MTWATLPLISALVACLAPSALGHGWMAVPSGRQLRECGSPDASRFLYPAGTGGGGTYEFEGGYPGLCGDGVRNRERSSEISIFAQQPCQQELEVCTQGGEFEIDTDLCASQTQSGPHRRQRHRINLPHMYRNPPHRFRLLCLFETHPLPSHRGLL